MPSFIFENRRAVVVFGKPDEDALDRLRIAVDSPRKILFRHDGASRLAREREFLQKRNAREEVVSEHVGVGKAPGGELRNGGRHRGACENKDPGDVEPEEKDGERHEGPVDRGKRAGSDVDLKPFLHDLPRDRDEEPADQRMRKRHLAVGNELEEHRIRKGLEKDLKEDENPAGEAHLG